MSTDTNMRFYEMGRSVPEDAQKAFSNGRFSGTDINPMWRIKKLTEMFGPCGIGWYTEVTRQEVVQGDEGTMMVFVDINLYVREGNEWSKPIFGTGGNTIKAKGKSDDEGYKKAYTDAMSIACKALGIGADIWYANDTTSKYADMYTGGSPATDIPARGSAEAAQKAGSAKLAQVEAKLAEARQTAPRAATGGKAMATEEQKERLRSMVNVEQLASCTKLYGPGWDKMSAAAAEQLIAKIQRGEA